MSSEFVPFPKIPRLSREIIITEKIDGTNASIHIGFKDMPDGSDSFRVASRKRWITPDDDNYGFAKWAYGNINELMQLGPGAHFGEWWGQGIQRGYGLKEKRFSLFNTTRWLVRSDTMSSDVNELNPDLPDCVSVVPELSYRAEFSMDLINDILAALREDGSVAAPGFMKPEGVVIYHTAANQLFKKTLEDDESPKGALLAA